MLELPTVEFRVDSDFKISRPCFLCLYFLSTALSLHAEVQVKKVLPNTIFHEAVFLRASMGKAREKRGDFSGGKI